MDMVCINGITDQNEYRPGVQGHHTTRQVLCRDVITARQQEQKTLAPFGWPACVSRCPITPIGLIFVVQAIGLNKWEIYTNPWILKLSLWGFEEKRPIKQCYLGVWTGMVIWRATGQYLIKFKMVTHDPIITSQGITLEKYSYVCTSSIQEYVLKDHF